jgi:hypothetical protein
MFSKIGDFIKPLLFGGNVVERPERYNSDKEERKKKSGGDGVSENKEDVTFFSIEAVRALLKQEKIPADDDVFLQIDLLLQNGIASIAIRQEQSILTAVAEAAAQLGEK